MTTQDLEALAAAGFGGITEPELAEAIAAHEAAEGSQLEESAVPVIQANWRTGRDASDPSGNLDEDGQCDIACGYIGGMTPHVWTPQQWAMQTSRYRFPIWVCDFRTGDAIISAMECLKALAAAGFKPGDTLMADLETQKPPPTWYEPFAKHVQKAGYKVVGYGSISTLFTHYEADGWIVADPTGVPHMYPHKLTKGTQYAWESLGQTTGPWDQGAYLSQAILPLHDTSRPVAEIKGVVIELPDGMARDVVSHDNGRTWEDTGSAPLLS